jgi:hypothetical protein
MLANGYRPCQLDTRFQVQLWPSPLLLSSEPVCVLRYGALPRQAGTVALLAKDYAPLPAPAPTGTSSLPLTGDLDLSCLLVLSHRDGERQRPLLVGGPNRVGIEAVAQEQLAIERALGSFGHQDFLLVARLPTPLGTDRRHILLDGEVNGGRIILLSAVVTSDQFRAAMACGDPAVAWSSSRLS